MRDERGRRPGQKKTRVQGTPGRVMGKFPLSLIGAAMGLLPPLSGPLLTVRYPLRRYPSVEEVSKPLPTASAPTTAPGR